MRAGQELKSAASVLRSSDHDGQDSACQQPENEARIRHAQLTRRFDMIVGMMGYACQFTIKTKRALAMNIKPTRALSTPLAASKTLRIIHVTRMHYQTFMTGISVPAPASATASTSSSRNDTHQGDDTMVVTTGTNMAMPVVIADDGHGPPAVSDQLAPTLALSLI